MTRPHPPDTPKGRTTREEGRYLLEILALTGFLVCQPVLDTFGRSPETFITRGSSGAEIIGFALAVATLPALALWLVSTASRLLGASWRVRFHVGVVGILVGAIALRTVERATGTRSVLPFLVGAAAGAGAAVLYTRAAWMRLYLRVASVAPAAFAALFLFASPTADLIGRPTVEVAQVEVPREAPSVLFIVLDQLPTVSLLDGTGHVDAELFPSFARLESGSTWYRNHSTVAPWTNMAVPAMLSGNMPISADTAPIASNYPRTLFTLLGGSYDLNVTEPTTVLCPFTLCAPARSDGLGALLGDAAAVAADRPDPYARAFSLTAGIDSGRVRRFDDFLASIEPAGARPRLDYLHLLLPHDPWVFLPSGVEYPAPEHPIGLFFANWGGEQSVSVGRQRHLLQVQLADRLLGEALDALDASDRFDDTLIVVTSDHGVAFTDQELWRGASQANFEQIIWTPLFVKEPRQTEGRVDDRNVWSVDVLPTVAEIIDVEIPPEWDLAGHSVAGGPDDASEPTDASGEGPRDPADKVLFPWNVNALQPDDDGLVHVDAEEGFSRVLDWYAAAPGDDPEMRLWRQGRYGVLVGTRPEEHRVGAPATFEGWLAHPEVFDDVDLDHEPPVHLEGVFIATAPGPDVAVAVNGVVAGWGPTVPGATAGEAQIWTLLAEPLLHEGANDVSLYVVEGPPADPLLPPVPMRSP